MWLRFREWRRNQDESVNASPELENSLSSNSWPTERPSPANSPPVPNPESSGRMSIAAWLLIWRSGDQLDAATTTIQSTLRTKDLVQAVVELLLLWLTNTPVAQYTVAIYEIGHGENHDFVQRHQLPVLVYGHREFNR